MRLYNHSLFFFSLLVFQIQHVPLRHDCMRKVGHMPQEDFPQETAKFIKSFLESELKVSALGSVRLGKIGKDDDYERTQ
jgi:hypothetical protein